MRLASAERELSLTSASLARGDGRARLLRTIPGVGWLLGLTFASEIGDISRFSSAGKLVGYPGLVPRVRQSGESSRTGRLARKRIEPNLGFSRPERSCLEPELTTDTSLKECCECARDLMATQHALSRQSGARGA
jgi:hypothetical protein